MYKNYFITAICILFSICNISAQSEKIDFKTFKNTENGKIVYFVITGLINDDKKESITDAFKNDKNVKFVSINKNFQNQDWCQLEIKKNIDANYIRKILQTVDLDFDMPSMLSKEVNISEHYPIFVDTGNPEKDKKLYDNSKKLWLKNYPKEVIKTTGRNYYNLVSGESFYINEKPAFIDTGDQELDRQMFEKRVIEWNKSHSSTKVK